MTFDHKYNEPGPMNVASSHQLQANTAFVRLLSLFSERFGDSNRDDAVVDDVILMTPVENSSIAMYWYDEVMMSDTSVGPCSGYGSYNTTCNNLTEVALGELRTSYATWQIVLLGLFSACTSLVTVVGNLIVILSFIIDRTIRQPTNYFIASLAVSDLLIGSVSMPFFTIYLLADESWILGEFLCDLWLSIDFTVCLCSIYTVFCITIDRFCSVTIPAKYRNWRTEQKVLAMVIVTWIVPSLLFFTSIFGWQYIVGERTVPEDKCYVQYTEEPLFNCLLQVGYFWLTLVVMCALYSGIYRVALELQRKSEAKHKKMTSLVSMAGHTVTTIGIGVTSGKQIMKSEEHTERTRLTSGCTTVSKKPVANHNVLAEVAVLQPSVAAQAVSQQPAADRSSSPAFASDTDHSAGSGLTSNRHNGNPKVTNTPADKSASSNDYDDAGIYIGSGKCNDLSDGAKAIAASKETEQIDCLELAVGVIASVEVKQTTSLTPITDKTSYQCDPDDNKKLLQSESRDQNKANCQSCNDMKQQPRHLSLSSIEESMSKGFRSRSQRSSSRRSKSSNTGGSSGLRLGRRCSSKKSSSRKRQDMALTGSRGAVNSSQSAATTTQSKSENRARKALRTITVILGAFVLCWTPWHVLSMIMSFCSDCVPNVLYNFSYLLCYLNSPINPFCYALANQQFKKTFARILRFDWRRI